MLVLRAALPPEQRSGALRVLYDLSGVRVDDLLAWHEERLQRAA